MPYFRDRVKDTTTTTGTGNITLSGTAPTAYQNFNTAFGTNTLFLYAIVDNTNGQWETGKGYLSASTTLVRDTVFDSSAGLGTLATFVAGTKDVFCTATAEFLDSVDVGNTLAKINGWALP